MKKIFHYFIITVIFISVLQTLLNSMAILFSWPLRLKHFFVFINFTIDLIFTVELFLIFFSALRRKMTRPLLCSTGFWINFFSSLPLLLLNSGLNLFLLMNGPLSFSVTWLLKSTAVFQYFRILKIAEYTGPRSSPLTRKHIRRLYWPGSIALLILLAFFYLAVIQQAKGLIDQRARHYQKTLNNIENINLSMGMPLRPLLFKLLSNDPHILKMNYSEFLVFSQGPVEEFSSLYDFDDYFVLHKNEYALFIAITDINKITAWTQLANGLILILVLFLTLFLYGKYFDRKVSLLLEVMEKGLEQKDYNLLVKTGPAQGEDELASLARQYNEVYLPLKQRLLEEEMGKSPFQVLDLLNFLKRKG